MPFAGNRVTMYITNAKDVESTRNAISVPIHYVYRLVLDPRFLHEIEYWNIIGVSQLIIVGYVPTEWPSDFPSFNIITFSDVPDVPALPHCPRNMNVIFNRVSRMKTLPNMHAVRHLEIHNCPHLEAVGTIDDLSALHTLVVHDCPKLDVLESFLRKCPNLTRINLRSADSITELDVTHLPLLKNVCVENCKNLERIVLPQGMQYLYASRCPHLDYIIGTCPEFVIEECNVNIRPSKP